MLQREIDRGDGALLGASGSNPADFEVFFRRHHPAILKFLTRRVGRDEAQTLSTQVFLVAFERRLSYEPRCETALPWLYGIATNVLREHGRAENRFLRAAASAHQAADHPLEPETLDRIEATAMWPVVAAALLKLSADHRDVLRLYAWDGCTYEQIAEILDIRVGTVRSRISRARDALKKELDK